MLKQRHKTLRGLLILQVKLHAYTCDFRPGGMFMNMLLGVLVLMNVAIAAAAADDGDGDDDDDDNDAAAADDDDNNDDDMNVYDKSFVPSKWPFQAE